MESKKIVAERIRDQIEKFDLTSNFEADVRIVNLCTRQPSLVQQKVGVHALFSCMRVCKSRNATLGFWDRI
jgi:hypothetical protein